MTIPKELLKEIEEAAGKYSNKRIPVQDDEWEGTYVQEIYPSAIRDDVYLAFRDGALSMAEKLAELTAERDNWRDEYENLCKFANQFEAERDQLREKLGIATDALREIQSAAYGIDNWVHKLSRDAISDLEAK